MIKTKFVFAVSLVAMLAVSSAWANAPASGESVGTAHDVYEDQTPTDGAGIAGVSYVNKAVNKAGASAQAAEAHAAAAGQSALNAASSAAAAAASAKSANDALANKQDKLGYTAENVANKVTSVSSTSTDVQYPSAKAVYGYVSGELATVNSNNNTLKSRVDTLEATTAALDEDKQDKLGYTAENSANKVTSVSSTSTDTQYPSAKAMYTALSGKQATISDLATIRSGAAAGATAVQDLGDLGVTATATELNYVDGVTSNIQTQLNAKENSANKVTSVSSTSTDTQYPSAKAMYTALSGKQATISDLATIRSGAAAGATAVQDLEDLGVTATATELNYVDGVTSNIQTQLNAKENSANKVTSVSSTSTDTQYPSAKAMYTALSGKQATISDLATIRSGAAAGATAVQDLGDLGVTATATELNYVDGVTSNIQTQLNAKQASLGYTAENSANKVTSVSSTSTDAQYPSAKAVYTALSGKQASLGYTAENSANKVTSVSSTSTDTQYPSAKAMYTALSGKQATISDLATIRSGAAAGATAVQDLGDLGVTATATELNYVDGVTSNIQTQLNAKQASLGYTAENSANKVTSVSSTSTDTQYPSAKAVYGYVSGELATVNSNNNTLKSRVDTLEATTAALDEDKQDKLTATGTANRPVYAVAGGVAAVTGMSIPYGKESNPTSWATIWVE